MYTSVLQKVEGGQQWVWQYWCRRVFKPCCENGLWLVCDWLETMIRLITAGACDFHVLHEVARCFINVRKVTISSSLQTDLFSSLHWRLEQCLSHMNHVCNDLFSSSVSIALWHILYSSIHQLAHLWIFYFLNLYLRGTFLNNVLTF